MFSIRQLLAFALPSLFAVHLSNALPKLDIRGKTFKLTLQFQFQNPQVNHVVEVEELHSAQQRRSILHSGAPEDEFRKTFYSSDQQVLKIGPSASECQSVSRDEVDAFCHGIPKSFFEGEPAHLIGLGKVLAFLNRRASVFKEKSWPGKFFTFEGSFQDSEQRFTVSLFYDKNSQVDSNLVIPQRIRINFNSAKNPWLLSYNSIRFQLLDDGLQSTTSAEVNLNPYSGRDLSEVSHDLFAFERSIGCSKLVNNLPESTGKKLATKDAGRFSFETKLRGVRDVVSQESSMRKANVVYESALSSLRVQQVGGSNSVYNFAYNRRFHATRGRAPSSNTLIRPVEADMNAQETRPCVITLIKDSRAVKREGNPFSLGRLLLGTEKLNYVGHARVRGIEARVYQWQGGDIWPIWLQPPLVYEDDPGERGATNLGQFPERTKNLSWRGDSESTDEADISMTNIFYFSKTGPLQDEIFDAKLLLVEVVIKNSPPDSNWPPTKFSLPIYDFTWDLPNSGPDGGRYEHSVSLHDDCLASVEYNNYATIEFELEVSAGRAKDLTWLQDRSKRNVALLELAQRRLSLKPVSMVDHIQSRLMTTANNTAVIKMTTRAAMRSESLSLTRYLCRANPTSNHFDSFRTINFDACHMIAAHQRFDTLFTYNVGICHVLRCESAHQSSLEGLISKICDEKSSDRAVGFQMYQVVHQARISNFFADPLDFIQSSEHKKNVTDETFLLEPSNESQAKLKVKHTLLETMPMNSKMGYNLDNQKRNDVNKFTGFGLVQFDVQNKLVEGVGQVISFEACQTACMADFECRSFSVCTSNGQMRCVLSTVSFSTPSIVLQLMQLNEIKPRRINEKFSINVDLNEQRGITESEGPPAMDSIQVNKSPTCELHNKLYVDYFRLGSGRVMYTKGGKNFRPVSSIDECAELCFRKTTKYLKATSKRLDTNSNALVVTNEHESLETGICNSINYVSKQEFERGGEDPERPDSTTKLKDVTEKLAAMNHLDEVKGFCVIDNDNNRRGPDQSPPMNEVNIFHEAFKSIWFNRYDLDFLRLFERMAGISLEESRLDWEARKKLVINVSGAVGRGEFAEDPKENLGWTKDAIDGPHYCAGECLRTISRALVGCRSFDYFEVDSPKARTRKLCAFNTVTLKSSSETNKTNVIRYGDKGQTRVKVDTSDTVRIWHFEPRAGLFSNSTTKFYTVSRPRHEFNSYEHQILLSGSVLISIVVILVVSGAMFGLVLGARILRVGNSDGTDALVADGSGGRVELANILEMGPGQRQ